MYNCIMNTSNYLKVIRKKFNLTQKQISNKFGIPIGTYEHWEMGIRKPPVYVVKMIEYVLNCEQNIK